MRCNASAMPVQCDAMRCNAMQCSVMPVQCQCSLPQSHRGAAPPGPQKQRRAVRRGRVQPRSASPPAPGLPAGGAASPIAGAGPAPSRTLPGALGTADTKSVSAEGGGLLAMHGSAKVMGTEHAGQGKPGEHGQRQKQTREGGGVR